MSIMYLLSGAHFGSSFRCTGMYFLEALQVAAGLKLKHRKQMIGFFNTRTCFCIKFVDKIIC